MALWGQPSRLRASSPSAKSPTALIWYGSACLLDNAILSSYAQAGVQLTGADPTNAEQAARDLLTHLAATTSQWFIVLDDLTNPSDLDGWWPPRTPTGQVIVTTRRNDAALHTHGALIPVDVFTRAEAYAYLHAKLPQAALDQPDLLAADLGRLPVALAQAAAYIADRAITCGEYRQRFADQRTTLLELSPDALPDDYTRPVAVTLTLSIDAANQLTPQGLARPLLDVLSHLDPNAIPRAIITTPAALSYLTSHRQATADHSRYDPVDQTMSGDAIGCLTRLSLAAIAEEDGLQVVRVHALVQRATRDLAPPTARAEAASIAANALLQAWPDIERDTNLARMLRSNTTSLRTNSEEQIWQPHAHGILYRYGKSLGVAGQVSAAVEHFHHVATIAVRVRPHV